MARRNTRRDFLKTSTLAGAGVWAFTSSSASFARARLANDEISFGCIGVGGKGDSDSSNAGRHGNVVAICDIDEDRLGKKGEQFSKAAKYFDYRKMLEDMGDKIDAVSVSTPDHSHAPASVMAMRLGKHVYCQKPLTWSVHEARVMREVAQQYQVMTQMGNQGTAADGLREAVEVLRAGAIGPVRQVHVWTNRPVWPQGIARPLETPGIPNNIHWHEFLGPAPDRAYHPAYHPFKWRGWLDYGTGALGDMACHTLNVAYHALELNDPKTIEVVATSGIVDNATYPTWSVIRTEFDYRGDLPPVTMTWYDGGNNLPADQRMPAELLHGQDRTSSGLLIVGDDGSYYSQNDYGSSYILLPTEKFADYKPPEPTLPRIGGGDSNHFGELCDAIRGGNTPMSNFGVAGRMTESVNLGVVALRAGKKIEWDGPNCRVTNSAAANEFVHRDYRRGWTL